VLLTQPVVAPEDCYFGIGIPVTRREFDHDLYSADKDFVPKRCRSWLRYYKRVIEHYEWAAPRMVALGVKLQTSLTLATFAEATRSAVRVITLYSHWTGDSVEFADRTHSAEEVGSAVSESYGGIFDLTVCQSTELAVSLRKRCPRALVKLAQGEAETVFWLHVYPLAYAYLKDNQTDFFTALAFVLRQLQVPLGEA